MTQQNTKETTGKSSKEAQDVKKELMLLAQEHINLSPEEAEKLAERYPCDQLLGVKWDHFARDFNFSWNEFLKNPPTPPEEKDW